MHQKARGKPLILKTSLQATQKESNILKSFIGFQRKEL